MDPGKGYFGHLIGKASVPIVMGIGGPACGLDVCIQSIYLFLFIYGILLGLAREWVTGSAHLVMSQRITN